MMRCHSRDQSLRLGIMMIYMWQLHCLRQNYPIHSKNLSTLSFMTMRNCLASQLYNMTLHISLDPHQLPRLSDKRHVFGVGGCKGEGNVAFQVTPICHYYSQGGSIDWIRTWWATVGAERRLKVWHPDVGIRRKLLWCGKRGIYFVKNFFTLFNFTLIQESVR